MKYSHKVVDKLNQLLVRNIDILNTYRNVIVQTENEKLKTFFVRRFDVQKSFVNTIKKEIFKHGQIPKNRNRFFSYITSNYFKIKYLLLLKNEKKIAKSFIDVEELNLQSCESVIAEKELPSQIKSVLISQRNKLQESLQYEKKIFELV
tara:strand:- start:886 stop:1332 length:447 start_codon:yes stop_codon:yes gene_type:complete